MIQSPRIRTQTATFLPKTPTPTFPSSLIAKKIDIYNWLFPSFIAQYNMNPRDRKKQLIKMQKDKGPT